MPQPFSMTNSGMLLQPILDPLARSDVSIGQSPCDLVPATPKLSVEMPFRDRKGVGSRATVIPAGFWRAELSKEMVLEGWQLILDYHSSIPRTFGGYVDLLKFKLLGGSGAFSIMQIRLKQPTAN